MLEVYSIEFIFACIFVPCAIWIARVDLESYLIPSLATFLLVFSGSGFQLLDNPTKFFEAVKTAAIMLALLWLSTELAWRKTGKEYLGLGDVYLTSALTLWVGPLGLPSAMLFSSSSALIYAIYKMRTGVRPTNLRIPFGPFLCFGFL